MTSFGCELSIRVRVLAMGRKRVRTCHGGSMARAIISNRVSGSWTHQIVTLSACQASSASNCAGSRDVMDISLVLMHLVLLVPRLNCWQFLQAPA